MAGTIERRSDAVALSRQAATIAATVTAALIVGVSAVLWNVVLAVTAHTEQLRTLHEFQNRGDRFTAADGARHNQRIVTLEQHQRQHEVDSKQGYARIRAVEQQVYTQNSRCSDLRERLAVIEDKLNGKR